MGQISQALALGVQVECGGQVYTVHPWTYRIQGEFERYLEREAAESVRRMPGLDAKERAELLYRVHQDTVKGLYSFGGELVQQALDAPRHLCHLLWLCLRPSHPDLTPDKVRDLFEAEPAKFLQAVNEANADPTRRSTGSDGPAGATTTPG